MTRCFAQGLLISTALVCAALECQGFSLLYAEVLPSQRVRWGEEVKLEIAVITPSGPGILYQPTEVSDSTEFRKFLIRIHPTGGPKHAISVAGDTVSFGKLDLGSYIYEVQVVVPPEQRSIWAPWAKRIEFGSFNISPELKIEKSTTGITVRWPARADRYVLEWTANIPGERSSWTAFPVAPSLMNSERAVDVPIESSQRFFRLRELSIRFP